MSIAKDAENYVLQNLNRTHQSQKYVFRSKGEFGFDIRNQAETHFVEVKGTSKLTLKDIQFRYLTDKEHKKAKECVEKGRKYEVIVVADVGNRPHIVARLDAKQILEIAKKETWWSVSLSKIEAINEN